MESRDDGRTRRDRETRLAAAIGIATFAVGAVLTWTTERTVLGALLMIAGGAVAIVVLLASRKALADDGAREIVDEPDDRLSAHWPRR